MKYCRKTYKIFTGNFMLSLRFTRKPETVFLVDQTPSEETLTATALQVYRLARQCANSCVTPGQEANICVGIA
jgi:exopolysaccharide biosynthesis predicted pyruvyltransferase EpsI